MRSERARRQEPGASRWHGLITALGNEQRTTNESTHPQVYIRKTMSLITFAVIGKDKSPLYLRDFTSSYLDHHETQDVDDDEDPFGFFEHQKNLNESSSLKNQVITKTCYSNAFLYDYANAGGAFIPLYNIQI